MPIDPHPVPRSLRTRLLLALLVLPTLATAGDAVFQDGLEEFVVLRGQAGTSVPLANARIVATAGGVPVETTADAQGQFELELTHAADTAVHLIAYGVGAQQGIAFASMPDTHHRLAARAGSDRVLTAQDTLYLNLSAFTTAMRAVMRPTLTGHQDAASFDRAAHTWDNVGEADTLALMVEAVARGNCPRDPAFADTVAMVESPDIATVAWRSLYDDTGWHCLSDQHGLLEGILAEASQRTPVPVPLGQELAQAYAYDRSREYRRPAFRLDAPGTGTLASFNIAQRAVEWTATNGVATMVPPAGTPAFTAYSISTQRYVPGETGSIMLMAHVEMTALRVRATEGPGGTLLLATAPDTRTSFPEEPRLAPEYRSYAFGWPLPTMIDRTPLASWNVVGQDWLLPAQRGYGVIGFFENDYLAVHRFAADGSGIEERGGRSFAWSVNASGNLQLDYSDGAAAEVARYSAEDPASTVIVFTRTGAGESYVTQGPSLQRNADTLLDAVPARFQTQFADNPFRALGDDLTDGSPYVLAQGGGGNWLSRPLQWSPADGRLRIDVFNPDGSWRWREGWEVVAVHGDDWYVLSNKTSLMPPQGTAPIDFNQPTGRLARFRRSTD